MDGSDSGAGGGGAGGGGGGGGGILLVTVASGVVTGVVLCAGAGSSPAEESRNTNRTTEMTIADKAVALAISRVRVCGDLCHGVADTGVNAASQVFSSNASKRSCSGDPSSANR